MTQGAALHQHWLLTVPIRQQGLMAAVWALFVFAVTVYWTGALAALILALLAALAVYLWVVRPLLPFKSITLGATYRDYWTLETRQGEQVLWVPHAVYQNPFCMVLEGGPLKGKRARLYLWRWTVSQDSWCALRIRAKAGL